MWKNPYVVHSIITELKYKTNISSAIDDMFTTKNHLESLAENNMFRLGMIPWFNGDPKKWMVLLREIPSEVI